ncbi:MAG: 5-(carboxyamino)imidazole ribonucleotide mutase [Clostridia bacterium]
MSVNKKPKVAIVMGSDSDFPILKSCIKVLKDFGVEVDVNVISAHRTPYKAEEFAKNAEANGIDVIIGAAGKAAHLPGVLAAFTTLPVIGLPIKSSTMDGLDSLLSIVQMPKGIPVATVAIDGADNAAILAVQILSIAYKDLKTKLKAFKIEMAKQVEEKNAQIKEEVSKL